MTVEATRAPGAGGEDRLRARALDTLRTATLDIILQSSEPLRTVDIARSVAGRLGLDLTEEEMGGLASVVRMVLDSDPMFSQANRQWDLALRMGRAEGDRRKPVERAVVDFIELIGHPAEVSAAAALAAAVYGRYADYYQSMISRVAPTNDHFFAVDGKWGVSRWLLDITSDDPEEVEEDNFPDPTVVRALRDAAGDIQAGDPASYARAIVDRVGDPVDNKALQFLTWSAFPDVEPAELFSELYSDASGLILERGPAWVTADSHRQVMEDVRTLARNPETVGEALAAAKPSEEEEGAPGILAPTTVRVSDDDLDQVHHLMDQEPRTYRVSELCQQALEAFPGSRTYQGIHDSLKTRMMDDPRFLWVGYERFRLAGTVPAEVQALPEGLAFDTREYLDEEENEVDRYIDPRDWKGNLEEQVQHYLVQDVADDSSPLAANPPKELISSPPLHHYVVGTRFLRNSDRGFFATTPALVHATLLPGDGSRFDVWVNNNLGLVFGLKEWFEANLPWVGGQFRIVPTDQPDEFRLQYSGETEPLMDIPLERLQELLQLRAAAATEGTPLQTIVERILKAHPEGVHFVRLFTEINVVRRVRREQVASALSSQRAFQQVVQQPGYWVYDEKRAAKAAKKKGPKRPMRDYDDDDDLIEE